LKKYLNRLLQSLSNLSDENFRSRLSIFLVCLLISVIIWLITILSVEYDTDVRFPLKYVSFPEDKFLVKATDNELFLKYEETGSQLFRLKYIMRKPEIVISLNNMSLKKDGEGYTAYLLTSNMADYISRQLDISQTLLSISPDTLYFKFEDRIEKSVPVIPKLELEFAQQFSLYDTISWSPENISISGPASMVNKIDTLYSELIILNKLKESISMNAGVITADMDQLSLSPAEINIMIPVEEYTEQKTTVPLRSFNRHGWNVKFFPETIDITFLVALKDYKKVTPEMFSLNADWDNVDIETDKKVKVQITKSPSFVRITGISPEKVEFILLK